MIRSDLKRLYQINNPTKENLDEYRDIDNQLHNNFEHKSYSIGDKIKLHYNPCSAPCNCYYNKKEHTFVTLKPNKIYTIKDIHYFGGGCPSVLLELEEIKSTHSYTKSLPANWFKPIK